MRSKLATQSVNFGEVKSNPRTENIIKITPHHMACRMLDAQGYVNAVFRELLHWI